MLFPTTDYALFFLVAFVGAWALRRRLLAHKSFLLLASYLFYGFWDWRFVPLLAGISLLAAFVGRGLQSTERTVGRKLLLAVGVSTALATLAFFKYLAFAAATLLELLRPLGLEGLALRLPEVALPVGISFFVFHAISLMVDAYRREIPSRIELVDALLYVAFFPQLVAGPILRAKSFLPQLQVAPAPEAIDASRALELIVVGLVKKVLIANVLASQLVDPAFETPGAAPGLLGLLAIYGYAAQIYCDFSGYTDLAIGSALLLGYRFPENFDAPYLASSPQDFWHRWHISLSTWLRDYLFIPLGGSRGGGWQTARNLAITMVLGGLWHGAAWNFVLWGALHGAGLVFHRRWAKARHPAIARIRTAPAWPVLARLLTFHFVCFGWVLFRAPSLDAAFDVLASLGTGWSEPSAVRPLLVLAAAVGILGQAVPSAARRAVRAHFSRWPLPAQGAAFAAAIVIVEALGPQGVAPFIYFQF